MTTIAQIARATGSQPHEIAALLDLGPVGHDTSLDDAQVAIVVAATLNAYAGDDDRDNIWQDVIYRLPGFDQRATEQADPDFRGETVILESGYRIEWDPTGWKVDGPAAEDSEGGLASTGVDR